MNKRRAAQLLKSDQAKPFWDEFDRYFTSVTNDLRATRDASYLRALDALDYIRGIPDLLMRTSGPVNVDEEV